MTQETTTRKKRNRHILLAITGVVVTVVLVAVVVLVVLLARKDDGHTQEQRRRSDRRIPMCVTTFESFGASRSNNSLRLSLSFKAPKNHNTMWIARYMYRTDDMYITAGTTKNVGVDENAFSTEVTIPDLYHLYDVYLRLYSEVDYIFVKFNRDAILNKGYVDIAGLKNEIVYIDDKIKPTSNGNLAFHLTLKTNHPKIRRQIDERSTSLAEFVNDMFEIGICGINTTAEPPVVFDELQRSPGKALNFSSKITQSTGTFIDLVVNVRSEYVQYGGELTLIIQDNATTDYISEIKHGVSVEILSFKTDDVVTKNIVGVFPFQNETYIWKRRTLICFAMGNPHPEITMFKIVQDQVYQSLLVNQEELFNNTHAQVVGYTVETNDASNQGHFVCRAKSNRSTAETTTEVRFAELAVINVTETGVVENTTEKIVINCQASGKPRPDIELNLFEIYGPDLIKTGLYQVNSSSPDRDTLIVKLTVSPPDQAIHTVFCYIHQHFREGKPIEIELFPYNKTNGIDQGFYDRMMDLVKHQMSLQTNNTNKN